MPIIASLSRERPLGKTSHESKNLRIPVPPRNPRNPRPVEIRVSERLQPVHVQPHPIERRRRANVEVVALWPAEDDVGADLGIRILPINTPSGAMQCTPSSVAAHTRPALSNRMPSKRPDAQSTNTLPPDSVPSAPTSNTRMCFGSCAAGRVDDEELAFVGGQGQAVWPDEVVDDGADLSARAVDAEHVVLSKLAVGLVTLVIRENAVRRIGKPDLPSDPTTTSLGLFSRLPL